jgi:F-type H+-transporting ATPase subunit b
MKKYPVLLLILLWTGLILVSPALAEGTGYSSEQWNNFIFRVLNFAAFFAILFILLRKPAGAFFRGRREKIARTLEYLETQARNLEEQNAVMRRQLSELTSERESVIAQYERDGARERDRIIADAQKTADSIVLKTEAAMNQELLAARRRLAVETGRLATQFAEELVVKNIQSDDQSRLVHEFMEQIIRLPSRF